MRQRQLAHFLCMGFEKSSFCKVNLLLNVLGKRSDGFHELETIMQPLPIFDRLHFEPGDGGIELTCSDPRLPTDSGNLVHRAADVFLRAAGIRHGVRIRLDKRIPLAAGLGGGSGNAATTLLGLNDLFGQPLAQTQLETLAASLGSDIPFFLQSKPGLATGRGERIQSLEPFPALRGAAFVLVHPGFGISTPWAYQQLRHFPTALSGLPGCAQKLLAALQGADLRAAGAQFFNSLEAPALKKYPLLRLYQDFFRSNGAAGVLMSGSGSTTFAVTSNLPAAESLADRFKSEFGPNCWLSVVEASASLNSSYAHPVT
jgi:4-diphosphocytidyl-2-C-methyl-D-erythritol kinase